MLLAPLLWAQSEEGEKGKVGRIKRGRERESWRRRKGVASGRERIYCCSYLGDSISHTCKSHFSDQGVRFTHVHGMNYLKDRRTPVPQNAKINYCQIIRLRKIVENFGQHFGTCAGLKGEEAGPQTQVGVRKRRGRRLHPLATPSPPSLSSPPHERPV